MTQESYKPKFQGSIRQISTLAHSNEKPSQDYIVLHILVHMVITSESIKVLMVGGDCLAVQKKWCSFQKSNTYIIVVIQSLTWGLSVAYVNRRDKSFCGRPLLTHTTHKMRVSTNISGYVYSMQNVEPSITDTIGTQHFVHYSEVSLTPVYFQ